MLLALWPAFIGFNKIRARQVHERKTIERVIDDVPIVYPVEPAIKVENTEALIISKQKTDDEALTIILMMQ